MKTSKSGHQCFGKPAGAQSDKISSTEGSGTVFHYSRLQYGSKYTTKFYFMHNKTNNVLINAFEYWLVKIILLIELLMWNKINKFSVIFLKTNSRQIISRSQVWRSLPFFLLNKKLQLKYDSYLSKKRAYQNFR